MRTSADLSSKSPEKVFVQSGGHLLAVEVSLENNEMEYGGMNG